MRVNEKSLVTVPLKSGAVLRAEVWPTETLKVPLCAFTLAYQSVSELVIQHLEWQLIKSATAAFTLVL